MSETSRAMVFTGPGAPLELREYPLPRLQAGEVLVEVTCCTLCGSDLHTFQGRRSTPSPTVLGHEILGRVTALPREGPLSDYTGRPLQVGDRVTWSIAAGCGTCFFCRRDIPQKCERLFKYGHEQIQPQFALSGGLAEYCHLAAKTTLFRVPDELDDRVACPANCATATTVAAMRAAGDCLDAVVLIQGSGMLGLTASALASSRGACEVIVCDVDDRRLTRAQQFGATRMVNLKQGEKKLQQVIMETTDGRGVDIVLEMSGSPDAVETGIGLLRTGGRYLWIGTVSPTRPVSISAETIVRKMLTIQGVHNYIPADLADALTFLKACQNRFPFETLVSQTFQLTDANSAFQHAAESGDLRVAVCPE